jgi:hypothetical protein
LKKIFTYSGVDAESEEHKKEDDSPEGTKRHHADGLWVRDENKARSRLNHIMNRFSLDVGHVAKR